MRFAERGEKGRSEFVSWAAAATGLLLSAFFGLYELRGRLFMNELLARNDAERTINLLLSVARSTRAANDERRMPMMMFRPGPDPVEEAESYVSAIEAHPVLKDRILGIAAYDGEGSALFRYGSAPEAMRAETRGAFPEGSPPREYRFDRRVRTLRIRHPFPIFRQRADAGVRIKAKDGHTDTVIFYELRETDLFRRNSAAFAVFFVWIAASGALILFVRRTAAKNAMYREELRSQRELVALGTAARTLAHEIKNPLSAISLQADLAARLCPGAAEKELAGIVEETSRIRLLVDRIGDFLREPGGSPERLGLAEFAAETLVRAGRNGAPLPVRDDSNGAAVKADRTRLRSVIENIARNAFDAGGPAEAVEARVYDEGTTAVFEIVDRGSGFPPDVDQDRLFDPFYTTKTSGFGLGLALSRRFVEAAGGKLTLGAREGGGAAVRVALPKAEL